MTDQKVSIEKEIKSLPEHLGALSFTRLAVLVDENTEEHCYPLVQNYLPEHTLIRIRSGEINKNISTCQHIWQEMTDARFDRHSLLLNLGGGVIGDMGGFCAATYKRGIKFINLPTTLLSQVDASVGGKLGIDFGPLKNHIGIFRIPDHVIIYPEFLKTLPQQQLRSGFAEVLKHGLIADAAYWQSACSQGLGAEDWTEMVNTSVEVKKKVVEQDPTEKGLRKILNYGHTVGHAIESYYLDTDKMLLHGEAIAIGMVCEAWLSAELCGLDTKERDEIRDRLIDLYGHHPVDKADFEPIARLMLQDKKNEGNTVLAALLQKVGEAKYDIPVSEEQVNSAIDYYNKGK